MGSIKPPKIKIENNVRPGPREFAELVFAMFKAIWPDDDEKTAKGERNGKPMA